MDIRKNFSTDTAKKILGNNENAVAFLLKLQSEKGFNLPFRTITRGNNRGTQVLNLTANKVWSKIVEHWDFESGEKIIRDIFRTTSKFKSGRDSYATMNVLLGEWQKIRLGNLA